MCCTEESFPIAPLFLQQSFIILLPLLSPFPVLPMNREFREVMAIHYLCKKNACSHHFIHLVPWYKLPCPVDKAGLCNKHGKLVQPRNCDFLAKVFRILIQVLSDLAASSTKSCTKFCRHIQHPSLSEEKAKPVEPERLKTKD
mgnify:CR=1 FL=1